MLLRPLFDHKILLLRNPDLAQAEGGLIMFFLPIRRVLYRIVSSCVLTANMILNEIFESVIIKKFIYADIIQS